MLILSNQKFARDARRLRIAIKYVKSSIGNQITRAVVVILRFIHLRILQIIKINYSERKVIKRSKPLNAETAEARRLLYYARDASWLTTVVMHAKNSIGNLKAATKNSVCQKRRGKLEIFCFQDAKWN